MRHILARAIPHAIEPTIKCVFTQPAPIAVIEVIGICVLTPITDLLRRVRSKSWSNRSSLRQCLILRMHASSYCEWLAMTLAV